MLMGTFARPPAGQWPDEYGVMKLETVPRGLVAQTLMPLRTRKSFEDFVGGPGEGEHA
jgi:lathosterol oxidase